ncbi:hypothetical protein EBZ80_19825, partial [bacterium]|nr:hypothetical protein [bacterium]
MPVMSRRSQLPVFATLLLAGAVGAMVFGAGACKSRHSIGGGGSGLRSAGDGPGDLDKILKELEVVDCTEEICGGSSDSSSDNSAGDSGSGAGGVAFVNPAAQDLQVAAGRSGVAREVNPLGDLDYGGAFDASYALAKSGEDD